MLMITIERNCKKLDGQSSTSPTKDILCLSIAMVIYAVFIGMAVGVEYGDVKMPMIVLMIMFVGVFMIGVSVSFMLLRQVIPLKIKHDKNEMAETMHSISDSLGKEAPYASKDNLMFSQHL